MASLSQQQHMSNLLSHFIASDPLEPAAAIPDEKENFERSNNCDNRQVMIHQNQISLTNTEAQGQGHGRQTTHFIFPGGLQFLQLHR